jgi:hypothetical protein
MLSMMVTGILALCILHETSISWSERLNGKVLLSREQIDHQPRASRDARQRVADYRIDSGLPRIHTGAAAMAPIAHLRRESS